MPSGNILHFGGIELRVTGSGNLRPTLYSLDDASSKVLVPLVMSSAPSRQPFRLTSFVTQKARLKVEVTDIDESFRINKIIIFVKPIYSSFPG